MLKILGKLKRNSAMETVFRIFMDGGLERSNSLHLFLKVEPSG